MKRQRIDPYMVITLSLGVFSALIMLLIGEDTVTSMLVGICTSTLGIVLEVLLKTEASKDEMYAAIEFGKVLNQEAVISISDAEEVYESAYNLIATANRSIKTINAAELPPDPSKAFPPRKRMYDLVNQKVHEGMLQYKRLVFISDEEKFLWVCQSLENWCSLSNSYVRYTLGPIPYLRFPTLQIVDDKCLIYGFQSAHSRGAGVENSVASTDPSLVQFFVRWFDEIWEQAIPLKRGKNEVDFSEVLHIADRLGISISDVEKVFSSKLWKESGI